MPDPRFLSGPWPYQDTEPEQDPIEPEPEKPEPAKVPKPQPKTEPKK